MQPLPDKSLPSLFLNRVYRFGTQPLFAAKKHDKWQWLTWNQTEKEFEITGKSILGLGVPPGFKAAILSENRPEWISTDMAIMACRGVTVPLYTTSAPQQIKYILEHSEARLLFVSNKLFSESLKQALHDLPNLKKVVVFDLGSDAAPSDTIVSFQAFTQGREKTPTKMLYESVEQIDPDHMCSIVYTSGTTGVPKGVMLSHKNLISNIWGASQVIEITPADVGLSFLPLSHTFERTAGVYTLISMGARIAFAEHHTKVLANIAEVNPTVICTVPRVLEKLYNRVFETASQGSAIKRNLFQRAISLTTNKNAAGMSANFEKHVYDKLIFSKVREKLGTRLRFFCSGGAALSPKVGLFLESIGIKIIQGYGLTETSPVICVNRLEDRNVETVGKPLPLCHIEVAEDGEILASGPNIMLGYYKDPEATSQIIDAQGKLHTGDIGEIDKNGHLRITDRKKELIATSGGKKIAPQPIENELKAHALVEQACLVGDGRKYIAALIVPNFEVLTTKAKQHGINYAQPKELLWRPEVRAWFTQIVEEVNKNLAQYETIKKFELLEQEFSINDEEITPTLKLKRRVISNRYSNIIEGLYQGS